jgi:di/tricarboxylate transporter
MNKAARKGIGLLASLIVPCLIALTRPLGTSPVQALILGSLVLTIIWWSSGLIGKIPASCFLLLIFIFFGSAPLKTVFSFPLSETFFLIVVSYLFSQGIKKSRLAEKTLEPFLIRYANSTFKVLVFIIVIFLITIPVIPQPLARLIIVAEIYRNYLDKNGTSGTLKAFLLFSVFELYAVINGISINADIILNSATVGFSQLAVTNAEWIRSMALPTAVYSILAITLLCIYKCLMLPSEELPPPPVQEKIRFDKNDYTALFIIGGTLLFWVTGPIHGINATVVTLAGVFLMFVFKILNLKDLRSVDIATMVFLTAAFAIGGIMKSSGIADVVFSRIGNLFPSEYSPLYIFVIILVTQSMHLLLGSVTTTMSVVLPSLLIICGKGLPGEVIMYITYISVQAHHILPLHSVAMMIGAGNRYFPPKLVAFVGIPMMAIIVFVIFFVCLPWWRFIGLL